MFEEIEDQILHDDVPEIQPNEAFNGINQDILEQIKRAKTGDPGSFPSYWELDENDIDEPTMEEIEESPGLKFLWAAENGNMSVLTNLYNSDPSLISFTDPDGYTALHRASYNGHLDVVQYLLDKGSDIERTTNDGWTPLHSAANWGCHEVAHCLLAHGANINAQSKGQQTPLHLAAANSESRETLALLLTNHNLDITIRNSVGETAQDVGRRLSKYHALFEACDSGINTLHPPMS